MQSNDPWWETWNRFARDEGEQKLLVTFCRTLLQSYSNLGVTPEDLAQDALLEIHEYFSRNRIASARRTGSGYFARASRTNARRALFRLVRRRLRRPLVLDPEIEIAVQPEDRINEERCRKLRALIEELPERDRLIMSMRLQDATDGQIAQTLRTKQFVVNRRRKKLEAELRRQLTD